MSFSSFVAWNVVFTQKNKTVPLHWQRNGLQKIKVLFSLFFDEYYLLHGFVRNDLQQINSIVQC